MGLFDSFVGGAIGAVSSFIGGKQANEEARNAQGTAFDQNRFMYQHRYQFQMDDMRKAGLNPILSYRQAPPGGPTMTGYQVQNELAGVAEPVSRSVSSAIDARRQSVQAAQSKAQVEAIKAQTKNIAADTKVKGASADQIKMDTHLKQALTLAAGARTSESTAKTGQITEQTVLTRIEQEIAKSRAQMAKTGATKAEIEEEVLETAIGKALRELGVLGRAVNPFASTAKTIVK